MRHLLTLADLDTDEIKEILTISSDIKKQHTEGVRPDLLKNRSLALLFEKPSLRTRVSFETAIGQLGGQSLYLGNDVGWGHREPIADFSSVLSQYADFVVCRTFGHEKIEELARYATCPVINGLTNQFHPCQTLADLLTIQEHFETLSGLKVAYLGAVGNVARSLAIGCRKMGISFALATPEEYAIEPDLLEQLKAFPANGELFTTDNPSQAIEGANIVYADVWTSMGQEEESVIRRKALAPFQINASLMERADPKAIFLHCLPAHRGEEVTSDIIDGPQSLIIKQAANRMHAQKGILTWLDRANHSS
ncbi:MAG: ornithine carbamoyltransferase [Pirellulaceae bacterium]|nr:ornithine carbamoyltransferase [Pirellulaceae bacterium]